MLDANTSDKLERLRRELRDFGSVAVAFSGGIDSALLAKVAHDELGPASVAITMRSQVVPAREVDEARAWCECEGIEHVFVDVDVLSIPGFERNQPDRCYHCKKEIFSVIGRAAAERGTHVVVEGSNVDDLGDYRPGLRAIGELGVRSPLREADLTKQDIRNIARELGIPMWNKPSAACLASRIAYGETITERKLARVEQAEAYLHDLEFGQVRVRTYGHAGELARIELEPDEIARLANRSLRERVDSRLRELGFVYVTLDLAGFRSGSMNATLR